MRRLAARSNGQVGNVPVDADDVREVLAYIDYLEVNPPMHFGKGNDQRGANFVFSGNFAGGDIVGGKRDDG